MKPETTQQVIPVKTAIPHPDYDPKNYSNDIMLLLVRKPLCCPCFPGSTLVLPPTGTCPLPPSILASWPVSLAQGREKTVQPHRGIQAPRPLAELDSLASSQQLEREAKQTVAVKPLRLPRDKNRVRPRQVCTVAGWGKMAKIGMYPDTLQEVRLEVQDDGKCKSRYPKHYDRTIELCVGNPDEKKSSFRVRLGVCLAWVYGQGCLGKTWDLETQAVIFLVRKEGGTARDRGNPDPLRVC